MPEQKIVGVVEQKRLSDGHESGIRDEKQRLYFDLDLWNEPDPILKERLYGLTHSEGNHGETGKTG